MEDRRGASLSLARLAQCSVAELEALYVEPRPVSVPSGCYRGVHLAWLDTPGARPTVIRPLQHLGFRLLPFGVDFIRHRWFFFHPTLGIGRFVAEAGRSRWRDTETVRLHYEVSRLPGPVRAVLYDEVKVLSPSLCLGIGGINAARGRGDHFFFALVA
jgi:hypothetical protein